MSENSFRRQTGLASFRTGQLFQIESKPVKNKGSREKKEFKANVTQMFNVAWIHLLLIITRVYYSGTSIDGVSAKGLGKLVRYISRFVSHSILP